MTRLQIRLIGPYFRSFSTNSYGYYSQTSQNLVSNFRIFASARIVRIWSPPYLQGLCALMTGTGLLPYIRPLFEGIYTLGPQ
jgi:hypothetical protein